MNWTEWRNKQKQKIQFFFFVLYNAQVYVIYNTWFYVQSIVLLLLFSQFVRSTLFVVECVSERVCACTRRQWKWIGQWIPGEKLCQELLCLISVEKLCFYCHFNTFGTIDRQTDTQEKEYDNLKSSFFFSYLRCCCCSKKNL